MGRAHETKGRLAGETGLAGKLCEFMKPLECPNDPKIGNHYVSYTFVYWIQMKKYEGTSKSFRTLFLKKIFIYVTEMRTTLLFNIISLLLDTFSPTICKLLNAVGKESLWLTAKPVMHQGGANRPPLRAFLRGPNRWKSERARSGL